MSVSRIHISHSGFMAWSDRGKIVWRFRTGCKSRMMVSKRVCLISKAAGHAGAAAEAETFPMLGI